MIKRLLVPAALAITLLTQGCGFFDGTVDRIAAENAAAERKAAADRSALWREIGRQAAEYRFAHPGQPLPDYLGPPPPLGITDCTSTLGGYGQLLTSCDSY
jgi:hypothetical protein